MYRAFAYVLFFLSVVAAGSAMPWCALLLMLVSGWTWGEAKEREVDEAIFWEDR